MEGYSLQRRASELLQENQGGSFMNLRTVYDYLYDAAMDFNKRTHYLTNTQTISVPGDSVTYTFPLNPDFVSISLLDQYNQAYIKYTANGYDSFITGQDYTTIVQNDSTATNSVIQSFSIIDNPLIVPINGTATATSVAVNGETTLNDSNAPFANVAPGDFVHDLSDGSNGSHGVVIAVTSTSQVVCCMFEGTNDYFTSGDSYIIVPQSRYQIIFQPIPSAVATATITYVQKPNPVYSFYRAYKLPNDALLPISSFAAFLYKYRDREPQFGDALYKNYDMFTRRIAAEMRRGTGEKQGIRCNFTKMNKRSTGMGSWSY